MLQFSSQHNWQWQLKNAQNTDLYQKTRMKVYVFSLHKYHRLLMIMVYRYIFLQNTLSYNSYNFFWMSNSEIIEFKC